MLKLYVIHDVKTDLYEPPIASENDETVVRWFVRCIQGVPQMRDFPEDFRLLCAGTYDPHSGVIVGQDGLTFVCSALDCIRSNQSKFEAPTHEKTQVGDAAPVQPSTEG